MNSRKSIYIHRTKQTLPGHLEITERVAIKNRPRIRPTSIQAGNFFDMCFTVKLLLFQLFVQILRMAILYKSKANFNDDCDISRLVGGINVSEIQS